LDYHKIITSISNRPIVKSVSQLVMRRRSKLMPTDPSNGDNHAQGKNIKFSPQLVLPFMINGLKWSRDLVWVPSKDLHGTAYVPPELKSNAKLAAVVLSLANILDAFLSQEILVAAAGPILGTCINLGLVVTKNALGTLVVRKREGTRGTRIVCLCGFSSLNLISCLVSAPGTEMMLNKSGIAQFKAQQIFLTVEDNATRFQPPSTTKYQEAVKECDTALKRLEGLPASDPNRDAAYVRTHGMHRERTKKWNLEESGIPLCVRSQMLFEKVEQEKQQHKVALDWDNKLLKRSQINNDLMFVKQEFPNQYALYFDNNENFKSGVEAFSTANFSFFGKLSKGDFAGVALSLLLGGISIGTSITACFLVVTFANSMDAKKSHSEAIEMERDRILHERMKSAKP